MVIRFVIYLLFIVTQLSFTTSSSAQLVINEVMSNPSNSTLAPYEYIELFNKSKAPIQLADFEFQYNNNKSFLPEYLLAPQQYVIICSQEALPAFERYGNVLALARWNILANTGATLQILKNETLIDAVSYRNNWHSTSAKRNGGWSLERINPDWTCDLRENWNSSESPNGGTPGRRNSILNRNTVPTLTVSDSQIDGNVLTLKFNSDFAYLQQLNLDHFEIDKSMGKPIQLQWNALLDSLVLTFNSRFEENELYTLRINPVELCSYTVNPLPKILFLQTKINAKEIIISEILFNPKEGGVDFVELYNAMDFPINLRNWKLGNRTISSEMIFIQPHNYLAITTNKPIIALHYPSAILNNILNVASLPPYPNQQGNVTLYTMDDIQIDSVYYNANMHDPLLTNVKGVSLERQSINPFHMAFEKFRSSATLHEGATPGYANSTNVDNMLKKNKIFFTSKTVSPNNDLHEDFLEIIYQFNDSDYYLNLSIYNDKGTLINRLIRNQSAGSAGEIIWNTENENGQKVPPGHYIMIAEIHNNYGTKERHKKAFVIVPNRFNY